jgi:hypothetical protein
VGVTIYRRRNAVVSGAPVGQVASEADLKSCCDELTDVELGLERHLENFQHLIAHYDADEAQQWSEDRAFWLGQWRAAGERCSFGQHRAGKYGREWEQLGVIHAELHDTEAIYTKELSRFGQHEVPRLDRIRERLTKVGQRIADTDGLDTSDKVPDRAAPRAQDPGESP